jgi:hypothetical protein
MRAIELTQATQVENAHGVSDSRRQIEFSGAHGHLARMPGPTLDKGQPEAEVAASPRGAWTGIAERGSLGGLRLIRWIYARFGRAPVMVLLTPIVAYFFVTGGAARRASMDYLCTLWATPRGPASLGGRPTWRHSFVHLYEFAENIVDSMIVWSGDGDRIWIDERGSEHLSLVRQGAAHLRARPCCACLPKTGIV